MTTARFDINGSPSTDGGYNAAHSEALTITLEDLPATDVRKVRVRVVLKSDGAPTLSFTEQPSPPVAPVVITMPSAAAGLVAYLVEVQINDGLRLVNGKITVVPEWTFQRLVVAPVPIDKVRATIYREESQYEAQGLANLITALARAVASGSAVIPSPLPAPVITTIEELDGDGNDVLVHMSAWIQNVTDGFEVHAPSSVSVDAASGYVSMAAGMTAATGLGAGVFQFDAAGRIQLVSLADGFYAESQGSAFETFGESVWRGGVTSTAGAVQLGTADGAGELPAAITIGGLPGSGTHAVALQGRVLTVQAALSLIISGPTVTINGQPTQLAKVAEIVATSNVTQSGAQTIDALSVGSGTARTVLCVGQSTPTQNGLFDAPAGGGAWTRRADFDSLGEYVLGTTVTIQAGTAGKGKRYRLDALSSSLPATWVELTGGGATDAISDNAATVFCADPDVGIDTGTGGNVDVTADDHIHMASLNETLLSAQGGGETFTLDGFGQHHTSQGGVGWTDIGDGSDFATYVDADCGRFIDLTDGGAGSATFIIRSGNLIELSTKRPSTDVLASGISLHGARATSFATAVTARKQGANIDFFPGAGRTEGTDKGGSVRVVLRPTINGWPGDDSAFEVWLANAGSDALVTRLCHISCLAGQMAMTTETGFGRWVSTNVGSFYGFLVTYVGTGAARMVFDHSTASATVEITSAAGYWQITDGTTTRIKHRIPADTATTNTTTTTLASFVPTARPVTYEVKIHAWDASLNVARWTKDVTAVLRSGAAAIIGGNISATAPDVSDAALSAARAEWDTSSTSVRNRGTGISGNLTWSCFATEKG